MKAALKKSWFGMICVLFFTGLYAMTAFSAELNDIVLEDGSVIRAEVISLQNGKYTLRSETLGVFTLDQAQINQILRHQANLSPAVLGPVSAEAAPVGSLQAPLFTSSNEEFQKNVEKAQAVLMQDPQAMQVAASMASDPRFKELLDDPAAVAALKSGDMATLMKNPEFLAIIQDPRMQDMAAKVRDKSKE